MRSSLVKRLDAKYYSFYFRSSFYFFRAVYFALKNFQNLLTDGIYSKQ